MIAELVLTGCGGSVRPLVAGSDACEFCRMVVSDVRYGAEVVARTGRVYTFDSIECVASWANSSPLARDAQGIWVADYSTGALVAAESALYVRGGALHSPMGRQIAAFEAGVGQSQLVERFGGEVLRWTEVVAFIQRQGLPGSLGEPRSLPPAATSTGQR